MPGSSGFYCSASPLGSATSPGACLRGDKGGRQRSGYSACGWLLEPRLVAGREQTALRQITGFCLNGELLARILHLADQQETAGPRHSGVMSVSVMAG